MNFRKVNELSDYSKYTRYCEETGSINGRSVCFLPNNLPWLVFRRKTLQTNIRINTTNINKQLKPKYLQHAAVMTLVGLGYKKGYML